MEKGPLGEFSPACRPGSGGKKGFQSGGKYRRGAVALNLYRVLAGVGVRATGVHRQTLVNDPAFPVPEDPQHQLPVRGIGKGRTVVSLKDLPGDFRTVLSRQAENADGADLGAGGYGGNGVRHIHLPVLACFCLS